MNCNQVESLLPLYAGHDLDARTGGRISMHLQSCAACTDARRRDTATRGNYWRILHHQNLARETFAGMRQVVWRQIETESTTPIFFRINRRLVSASFGLGSRDGGAACRLRAWDLFHE
jgi:hypothetical protein